MLRMVIEFFLVIVLILSGQAKVGPQASSGPQPTAVLIREEQEVEVNGRSEVWRLQWKSPPTPACGPEEVEVSLMCPCSGFAYGESGALDLVRIASGRVIERLELTPLFENTDANQGGAIVQRWAPQETDSKNLFENYDSERFVTAVHARPVVKIIQFADYDHDGKATEFYLQTDTLPCGKHTGIVVGLTPNNPRLHIFGTALHPNKPLVMQKREWTALLRANSPVEVLDWPCGDHGSETQTFLNLYASNGAIQATLREYECADGGKRGRLIRKQSL